MRVCKWSVHLPDSQLSSFSIMDVYICASHEKPVWEKEEEEFHLNHRGRNMISIGKYFSGMGESYHRSEVIWLAACWGWCLPQVSLYWYIHKFCWYFDISLICILHYKNKNNMSHLIWWVRERMENGQKKHKKWSKWMTIFLIGPFLTPKTITKMVFY